MSSKEANKCLSVKLHEWLTTSDSETEIFLTPLKERLSPYFDAQPHPYVVVTNNTTQSNSVCSESYKNTDEASGGLQRSDNGPLESRPGIVTLSSTQTVFRFDSSEGTAQQNKPKVESETHSYVVPQALRRASTDPNIDIRNRYRDPAIDSATLQQTLKDKVTHVGQPPSRPWKTRPARAADGPFGWTNPQDPCPGFMWYSGRSNSHPTSETNITAPSRHRKRKAPLKSSMRTTSKSANATPSDTGTDSSRTTERQTEHQPLRRIKTVDFKDTIASGKKSRPTSRTQMLPPLKPWSSDPATNTHEQNQTKQAVKLRKAAFKRAPSCPGPMIKSTTADTALTKTDVHVVAIAPSWDEPSTSEGIDPATPTMQIVESQNSSYEVIWDDVPTEGSLRARRKNSVASVALRSVASPSVKSLDRVNSKLYEWNWGRGPDVRTFAPQIVVFPEDDGQLHTTTPAVDERVDLAIKAPPNSERTSGGPSRPPSAPPTALSSRPGSQDETELAKNLKAVSVDDLNRDSVAPLVVPNPEAALGASVGIPYKSKKPLENRRLSNIDDSEVKFRGHRDSVTIARSRLLHDRKVSPELFEIRDSISLAKKRMHAKNFARSEEEIAKAKIAKWEPLLSLDADIMTPPLPTPPTGPATPSWFSGSVHSLQSSLGKSEEEIAKEKIARWEPILTIDPAVLTSPLPTPSIGTASPKWGLKSYSSGSIPRSKNWRHIQIED